jgi:hypothetical protein
MTLPDVQSTQQPTHGQCLAAISRHPNRSAEATPN